MKKQTKEVECKEYLVVKDGKYFLEVLDSNKNLITLPFLFMIKKQK